MPDNDIFDDDKVENKNISAEQTKPADVIDDKTTVDQLLATIVNEDGEPKYKTAEEAIKAMPHAQDHIKTLETELAELRDKGNASDKLDELLAAVKSKGSGQDDENVSTMKPEDVLGIVKDFFSDTKAAEAREDNIQTVVTTFKNRFGKDASKELYGKADDLGFSREEINSMIASNPTAVLKILNVEPVKQGKDVVAVPSGVRTDDFRGKHDEAPTTIMGVTKAGEIESAWAASKQKTLERLGIELDK